MNVLVVSGIWPPDVGGPASHAPELAAFLRSRGHGVEVVTTADVAPEAPDFPIHAVLRSTPVGVRHARVAALIARRARSADVVYATSMISRAGLGSTLARRPLVLKLVADAAYERAKRQGLFAGSLAEFQEARGRRIAALRLARDLALRRASHVVCPSAFLRELSLGWGLAAEKVTVVPNAIPPLPALRAAAEVRGELGLAPPLLAFAGRINAQKALDVLLEALAQVDGPTLALAGDGPERERLEARATELELGDRVRFLGARTRTEVLELFRRGRRLCAHLRLGELPAHGRRGARGGDAGARNRGRRRGRGRSRRRERAARAAGRSERLRRGAAAVSRATSSCASGCARRPPTRSAHLRPERVYGELERILERAAGS